MSNLGSLVVSLEANIAKFQSDLGKAAAEAQKRAAEIDKTFGLVKNSLTVLGAGFLAGFALDKIKDKIEGVIESAAKLEDLSARTGATVESLSALSAVAKFSGTDTEALATGLQKLSKSMIDAENGGKKTSAAFEAIGISAASLKDKSPEDAFLLLSKQLDKYQDGAGKTVIAQALLGKAGANLLPVLKDLNTVGEYVTKTTTEQAEAAKQYEDDLLRLQAASNAVYKTVGLALLPVMDDLVSTLVEAQTKTDGVNAAAKSLAADHSIREWAQEGATVAAYFIESFQAIAKTVLAVSGSFQVALADMKLAKVRGDQELNDVGPKIGIPGTIQTSTAQIEAALAARNKVVEDANKRYSDLWNFDARAVEKNLSARFAGSNAAADLMANGDARDMQIRKAVEDSAKRKAPVNTSGLGNQNDKSYQGPKDDPAKKELEGSIKAQEALIASEKTLLATREQNIDFYKNLEYFTLRDAEQKKQELISVSLANTEAAYDKEVVAIKKYIADSQAAGNKTNTQDGQNKLDEVAKKRAAAEVDANNKISESEQKLLAVKRQFSLGTEEVARQQGKENDASQFQIDMLGRNTLEVQKLVSARNIQLALDERIYQLQKQDPTVDTSQAIADAAIQQAKASALIEANYNKQRDAVFGASEALRKYSEDASNSGQQIENSLTSAFKGAEDALVTFVTTGKGSFKDLANSIISDLARIAIRQNITGPLASALGGLFGVGSGSGPSAADANVFDTFITGLAAKASGGPVSAGTPYMVGEMGKELFVPTQSGTIIPNSGLSGGGGAAPGSTVINNFTVGDVATVSMVRQAIAGSQKQVAGGIARSQKYGGALAQ